MSKTLGLEMQAAELRQLLHEKRQLEARESERANTRVHTELLERAVANTEQLASSTEELRAALDAVQAELRALAQAQAELRVATRERRDSVPAHPGVAVQAVVPGAPAHSPWWHVRPALCVLVATVMVGALVWSGRAERPIAVAGQAYQTTLAYGRSGLDAVRGLWSSVVQSLSAALVAVTAPAHNDAAAAPGLVVTVEQPPVDLQPNDVPVLTGGASQRLDSVARELLDQIHAQLDAALAASGETTAADPPSAKAAP